MLASAGWSDVVAFQTNFLESLGIVQVAYAPKGYVGRGSVRYLDMGLKDRLLLAGFDAPIFKSWFTGRTAMTVRSMFRVAEAALKGSSMATPVVGMALEIEKWPGGSQGERGGSAHMSPAHGHQARRDGPQER